MTLLQPVLEVGGTHVTAALVDLARATVKIQTRTGLDADASAEQILNAFGGAARSLKLTQPATWGVAVPGPFDYETGVGRFEGVGKFAALNGVDLNRELVARLPDLITGLVFINDADAFGLGEWRNGFAGRNRVVCVTLGTGVGSCFIDRGRLVHDGPGIPPHGHAYRLSWAGKPLEDSVSRRALTAAYFACSGISVDVRDIAERARGGDARAERVFDEAFTSLGRCFAPVVASFGAEVVVLGGSITGSWDLVSPPFSRGLVAEEPRLGDIPVRRAVLTDTAPLMGAAYAASTIKPVPPVA